MGSKSILGYPGHAYAPGNDSPTPWGRSTGTSRLGECWAGTHSIMHFIKIDEKSMKNINFQGFTRLWFLINFYELYGTVHS